MVQRKKLSEQFLSDLLKVWGENGEEALTKMKEDDYAAYLQTGAAILSKAYGLKPDDALRAMFDSSPVELAALAGEGLAQRTGKRAKGSEEIN